jgi:Fibronectin-binding protein A N-terminus (FbpA)
MAFDGITIANIVKELNETIVGGKINKIAQPEADELLLTIKNNKTQYRLLISASASLPLIYFTDKNKVSPLTAPNFCMLLRKHIGNGKITAVTQPDMERVIEMQIEHLNELGDLCFKTLVIEIMGKHSNIIFLNENRMILDSIKHISCNVSSVREVLPGRDYFLPQTQEKQNPLTVTQEFFFETICTKPVSIAKGLYTSLTGISPCIAEEICYRASLDGGDAMQSLSEPAKEHLFHTFSRVMEDVQEGHFLPNIVYNEEDEPLEYASIPLTKYGAAPVREFSSISEVLEAYYAQKDKVTRIRQKSSDLRRIVQTALERNRKKLDLQEKQMRDTQKMDKYKVYGELINTYGYNLEPGCKSFSALNYYTNEEITIPLDSTMTPQENAKKYFDKYNKLKRTAQALEEQIEDTRNEILHLESVSTALDIALGESDLSQIKEELTECGYLKKHYSKKKKHWENQSHSTTFPVTAITFM